MLQKFKNSLKYNIKNQKAFTLFEIVLALIIFSMLIGIIFKAYINIQKAQGSISRQQIITEQAQDFLDRVGQLSIDYTLDYEEYFNRSQSTCLSGSTAPRNTGGACDVFTAYGNTGANIGFSDKGFYYCNSIGNFSLSGYDAIVFGSGGGCGQAKTGNQPFGEYNRQFRDTVDQYLNNGDDIFTGKGPIAISQNTGVQELYLINNDGNRRIFFRRKFLTGVDLNGDGVLTGKNERLYVIQVLKTRGFDAGLNHDFDLSSSNWGAYDGFIDTRACDYNNGFKCGGGEISGTLYPGYELQKNIDDGRETITDTSVTVSERNFELYPAKDPYLAQSEYIYLIDPFAKINLTLNLYGIQSDDEITLQTSVGFKNSYSNFNEVSLSGVIFGTGTTDLGFCGDGIIQNPNGSGNTEECDDGGYTGSNDGCSDMCEKSTKTTKCIPSPLTGGKVENIATEILQTCDNSNISGCSLWIPSTGYYYNESQSTGECRFICDTGYNYNSATEECDQIIASTGDFVILWQTDLTGSTSTPEDQIRIPTNHAYAYNYDVDCDNDLEWDITGADNDVICTYANTGIYTVRIRGDFPAIYFNNTGDKEKILSVVQRGTGQWRTMRGAFYGCSNLGTTGTWSSDIPDLSNVTDMYSMFRYTSNFNKDISTRDISNVNNLNWTFGWASSFNQPLNTRDTSNISNMAYIFAGASSFDQDISNRNTDNVLDMQGLFWFASSFNQPLNNWNVSNVTNMRSLFAFASSFNQPLNNWDVSNVTNMYQTFGGSNFNQDISSWDVSKVTTMNWMFGSSPFNQDISSWDVSSVEDMHYMFGGNSVFNSPLNRGTGTASVVDMSQMFSNASSFNQNICDWDVGNVFNMSTMFQGASSFNQTIKCWKPEKVINMNSMFQNASSFNQDFGNWQTTSLVNMERMFSNAGSFDKNIGTWIISGVSNMTGLFFNMALSTGTYDSILSGFYGQAHKTGIVFDAGNSQYCNAGVARSGLIINDERIINDGGKYPGCP